MSPRRSLLAVLVVVAAVAGSCTSRGPSAGPATDTSPSSKPPEPPSTVAPPATPSPTTTVPATGSPAPAPPAGEGAAVISRGDPERMVVALTFDAGADTGYAGEILDTLAAEGVPASFGITGAWAEANPELVARMAAEGHQIINHTWDHRSFTGASSAPAVLGREARGDQLERTDAVIRSITGRSTKPWFRPPFGDYDTSVNADVAAAGYAYNVLWTVDSLGWQGLSAAAIASRCLERAVPGAILLFHVGAQSQDARALPDLIARLRAGGYSFATVAEVVGV